MNSALLPSRIARAAGAFVFLTGAVGLLGWVFGIPAFKSVFPSLPRMDPNTAAALLIAGAALPLLASGRPAAFRRRAAVASGALVLLFGALALANFFSGSQAGLNRLFEGPPVGSSLLGGTCLLGLGAALALRDAGFRWAQRSVDWLIFLPMQISFLALIGYACRVPNFYGQTALLPGAAMSLHTAFGCLALGAGLLCSRPETGLMGILASRSAGGVVARRLLLAPVLIPLLTGLIGLASQRAGLYNREIYGWVFSFLNIFLFTSIIWWIAALLKATDQVREGAEQALCETRDHLETRVQERTAELLQANEKISRDIADRLRAEALLARESQLLRTVIDHLPDFIYAKDTETRFLLINAASLRLMKLETAEQVLGKTVFDFFPPEQAQAFVEDDRRVLESGLPIVDREEPITGQSGLTRCLLTTKVPLRGMDGQVAGLVGISRDITERYQAAEALRASEERFRQLAEHIEEVFWMTDPERSRIIYISPAYETIWGRSCASLRAEPRNWLEAIHPEDRDRVLEASRRDRGRASYSEEFRIIRPDGSVRWVHDRAFPIRDQSGAVYRVAGVAQDITEKRRLEEGVRQAQKIDAFGQLAGGVAHDFNNLLCVISGHADLLRNGGASGEAVKDSIEQIDQAAQRAASLTRQLLAFSRRQVLEPKALNLNTLVADTGKMLRRLIGEDVRLVTDLAPDLAPVKVDPGQIDQVLINLAVNARDAMPRGGQLRIETRNVPRDEAQSKIDLEGRPGSWVMLAVTDNGHGIAPEIQARIFEPFFTTKEVGKGTGLGLAVVHGIVKQSGGQIEVRSEAGGETTFRIFLPAVREAPARSPVRPAIPAPGGAEKILLVEDEIVLGQLVAAILRRLGYTVLHAASGREALEIMSGGASAQIDLLITDVVMPGMSGRELAQHLHASRPSLKVLFVSGYTDDAVMRHGILHSEVAFLQKPFTPSALGAKVREVLDKL